MAMPAFLATNRSSALSRAAALRVSCALGADGSPSERTAKSLAASAGGPVTVAPDEAAASAPPPGAASSSVGDPWQRVPSVVPRPLIVTAPAAMGGSPAPDDRVGGIVGAASARSNPMPIPCPGKYIQDGGMHKTGAADDIEASWRCSPSPLPAACAPSRGSPRPPCRWPPR